MLGEIMGNRFILTYMINGQRKKMSFYATNNMDAQGVVNAQLDLIQSNHKEVAKNIFLARASKMRNRLK
jgi:hypothetical protein